MVDYYAHSREDDTIHPILLSLSMKHTADLVKQYCDCSIP